MSGQNSDDDKPKWSEQDQERIISYNVFFLVAAGILFLGLFFINCEHPDRRGLIAVATGFVGLGATLGFIFSSYDTEKEDFSPMKAAIHGLLGGAAITDLSKGDSIIRKIFHLLADAGNLPAINHGLVIAMAATFTPLGFFFLYINRKLGFNPAAARADKTIEAALRTLEKGLVPTAEQKSESTEVTEAATKLLEGKPSGKNATFDELLSEAKAYYALGKNVDAVSTLRKALGKRPGDVETSMYLAAALGRLGDYINSAALLEEILKSSEAPVDALRQLGYVLLFYPDDLADYVPKIERAIAASKAYLKVHPEDAGAKINLACAYAQLSPKKKEYVSLVQETLTPVLVKSKEARDLVRRLTEPDQDFHEFLKYDWFIALLKDPV